MCGIVGVIEKKKFSVRNKVLKALQRLEYRGYDSVGFVTKEGNIKKQVGSIAGLLQNMEKDYETTLAIAHTRWATHGGVTQLNAHPHFNNDVHLFVCHNGIIENYQEIKAALQKKGVIFLSQTDSEVIPHFLEEKLHAGKSMKEAIQLLMEEVKGTYAILIIEKEKDVLYAVKKDSPLALGIRKDGFTLGSDIYAFSDETDKAIFFEDNEFAIITAEKYQFYNKDGKEIEKNIQTFEWTTEETEEEKQQFEHYMIKEIKEQPAVARRLLNSFTTTQKAQLEKFVALMKDYKKIVFVASGTSYHAALIGCILLNRIGYNARANIASEIETFVRFDKDTLVIAISQSGETMDVIIPLKNAKAAGAKIASIVNVPYSTIQRWSDISLEVLAGQEVCVASTKAYTNQVILLLKLAHELGHNSMQLDKIPERIEQTIDHNEEQIKQLAKKIQTQKDIFVLGKTISYPMAREIALKLKEISYIHAEGMMAGELKHGTIALIEQGTLVIVLIPNKNPEMLSSTKEVEARGAAVIAITNEQLESQYTEILVPKSDDAEFAIYSCIIGHLLSYYIAKLRGLEIDKPRNLAKSVTVK
ncbi:glutamine--fructose-6-phosphate transaminase (isomerizing) [Candidatus Woesearchaeota archaeon]|nr:glutamine--fructose-6-phosphate transaminase (isomerizing) [Candidatus Woesearchaeota archaeon]